MPVSVIVRVSCDVFLKKEGSSVKKKCGAHDEFEAANIVKARWAAEDAGWRFITTSSPDKALCPRCGPSIRGYTYGGKR